jgi:hypothetical protein
VPIISGGGGGGLPLTGGTLTGELIVDAGGAAGTTKLVELRDANAGDATALELGQDGRVYINRFEDTGRSAIRYDSYNNNDVFDVTDGGGVTIHPDSGWIPLEINVRDTSRPSIAIENATAAPTTSISSSTLTFWLDATAGAPQFRALMKDSAGAISQQIVERASPIASGALPTVALVSGTGAQILVTRAAETVTPFTGDGTNNAATCAIALSPDNLTYSTVATISIAAALNLTGVLTDMVNARVPAGWYLKLTAVHGTLGTTTYY